MPKNMNKTVSKYREYGASEGMANQEAVLPMIGDILDPQEAAPDIVYSGAQAINRGPLNDVIDQLSENLAGLSVPSYITNFLSSPELHARASTWVGTAEPWYYRNNKAVPITSLTDLELEDFAIVTPELQEMNDYATTAYNEHLIFTAEQEEAASVRASRQLTHMVNRTLLDGADFYMTSTGETLSAEEFLSMLGAEIPAGMSLSDTSPITSEAVSYNGLLGPEFRALMDQNFVRLMDQARAAEMGLPRPTDWEPLSIRQADAALDRAFPDNVANAVGRNLGVARKGIGWLFDKAITYTVGEIDLGSTNGVPNNPFNEIALDASENAYVERQRVAMTAALAPGGADYNRALTLMGATSFEELLSIDPERAQQFVAAGNGDINVARALYTGALASGDQGDTFIQLIEQRAQDSIDYMFSELEEINFTASAKAIDILGAYGRMVPGTLATGVALLVESDDFRDDLVHGRMGEAYQQISDHEHKPSSVFGMEGTFMGLVTDLGMTGLFDPTTWFFAPARGAASYNQFARATNVRAWIDNTSVGRRIFDDTYTLVRRSMEAGFTSPGATRTAVLWGMPLNLRRELVVAAEAGNRFLVKTIYTEAMLKGWKPFKNSSLLGGLHSGAILKEAFNTGHMRGLTRFFTAQNSTTTFSLSTATGYDEMLMSFARVLGDDGVEFNAIANRLDTLMMGAESEFAEAMSAANRALSEATDTKALLEGLVSGRVRPTGEQVTLMGKTYDDMATGISDLRLTAASMRDAGEDEKIWSVMEKTADDMEKAYNGMNELMTQEEWQNVQAVILQDSDEFGRAAGERAAAEYGDTAMFDAVEPYQVDSAATKIADVNNHGDAIFLEKATNPEGTEYSFSYGAAGTETTGRLTVTIGADGKIAWSLLEGNAEHLTGVALKRMLQEIRSELGAGVTGKNYENLLQDLITGPELGTKIHAIAVADLRKNMRQPWLRDRTHEAAKSVRRAQLQVRGVARSGRHAEVRKAALEELERIVARDTELIKIPGLVTEQVLEDGTTRSVVAWDLLKARPGSKIGLPQPAIPAKQAAVPGEIQLDEAIRRAFLEFDEPGVLRLPVSPLDIIMARGAAYRAVNGHMFPKNIDDIMGELRTAYAADFAPGGRMAGWSKARQDIYLKYLRGINKFAEQRAIVATRDIMRYANHAWVYDKVLRPSTAFAVSLDEALRIVHSLGIRETLPRYAQDKLAGLTVRWANRMGRVGDFPVEGLPRYLRWAYERMNEAKNSIPEHLARSHQNIMRTKSEATVVRAGQEGVDFRAVATQYSKNYLSDEGFRLWLRGDADAFSSYLDDINRSSHHREMYINVAGDNGGHYYRPPTREEISGTYDTIFRAIYAKGGTPDEYAEILAAWQRQASRIDDAIASGGALTDDMFSAGNRYLDRMKEIPIWKKSGNPVVDKLENMFESQFAYREGFLSRYARTAEVKRLESLFASQDIRILANHEIADFAASKGLSATSGLSGHILDQILLKHGAVTRRYIDDMAEFEATRLVEDMLYKWHLMSPAGKASRHVYPFGKPWADMWGFWMKRILERPVLRGVRPSLEHPLRTKILDRAMAAYPTPILPNRAGALTSRLASTDFSLENQETEFSLRGAWSFLGGDSRGGIPSLGALGRAVFGDTVKFGDTNLGGSLFLATQGDNLFVSSVPGVGLNMTIPLELLDMWLPDPDEDVAGWQAALAHILPLIDPGRAMFPDADGVERVVSNGWISFLGQAAFAAAWQTGAQDKIPSFWGTGSTYTPLQLELNRSIANLQAEPGYLENVLQMTTTDFEPGFPGMHSGVIGSAFVEAEIQTLVQQARTTLAGSRAVRQLWPLSVGANTTFEDSKEAWLNAAELFTEELVSERAWLEYKAGGSTPSPDSMDAVVNQARSAFFELPRDRRLEMVMKYPGLAAVGVGLYIWNTQQTDQLPGLHTSVPYAYGGGLLASDDVIPPEQIAEEFQRLRASGAIIPRPAEDIYLLTLGAYFDAYSDSHHVAFSQVVESINESITARYGNVEPYFSGTWQGDSQDNETGRLGFSRELLAYTLPEDAASMSTMAAQLGISIPAGSTVEDLVDYIIYESSNKYASHPLYTVAMQKHNEEAGTRSRATGTALQAIRDRDQHAGSAPDLVYDAYNAMQDAIAEFGIQDRLAQDAVDTFREQYAVMAVTYPGPEYENEWSDNFAARYGPYPVGFEFPRPPGFDAETHPRDLPGAYQPYIQDTHDGDSMAISRRAPDQGFSIDLPGPIPATPDLNRLGPVDFTHQPRVDDIRLIGVRSRDYSDYKDDDPTFPSNAAEEDHDKLYQALRDAPPGTIWLVPDPEHFGNVDRYGRQLAWLWINGTWYYSEDALYATDF